MIPEWLYPFLTLAFVVVGFVALLPLIKHWEAKEDREFRRQEEIKSEIEFQKLRESVRNQKQHVRRTRFRGYMVDKHMRN